MNEHELLQQVGIGMHVEIDLIDDQGQDELMAFDLVKIDAGKTPASR